MEAQIYQLTDCISSGDTAAAIRTLRDLLALRFEPVVLAGAIARQVQKLYAAKLVLQQGMGEEKLMGLFAMRSSYPAKLLLRAAQKRSLPWLRRALHLCCPGGCGAEEQRARRRPRVGTAAAAHGGARRGDP